VIFVADKFSCIAIGAFDGVHLGHAKIISRTVDYARQNGLMSVIFTMPFPIKNHAGILSCPDEKVELLSSFSPDQIVMLNVRSGFLDETANDFLRNFLIKRFNVKEIVCGPDFAFGKDRQGDISWLKENAKKYGIGISVVKPLTIDGKAVSSTVIRQQIIDCDIAAASKFLGRDYSFRGRPFKDLGLATSLGYPTINLKVNSKKLMPCGVFVALTKKGADIYPAIANLGFRPSVDTDGGFRAEVHLLNFDGVWPNVKTDVSLLKFVRSEQKFNSLDELKSQIAKDKDEALKFFDMA
jgi:riboflavin kinase/FMN adenylyltransferase